MSNLRAALVLAVMAIVFIVGTPGLDHLGSRLTAKEQARLEKRLGPSVGGATAGLMQFNANVRRPAAKRLGKFQPVFRVRQSWNLYRDGPRNIHRLEIRVDEDPVFRSGDPELDWLAAQLGNRRMRPVVESTTKKFKSANWRGLSRYVVAQARQAWPEAQKVELIALRGKRPGKRLKPTHRITATAPDWSLEKQR